MRRRQAGCHQQAKLGTDMTIESDHLPALSTIDPAREVDRALSTPGIDTGFFVFDAIRQAVSVAAEMMRPSVRKLAERLATRTIEVNGWTFRRVKTGNRWDVAFVAENPHLPGGYLYNMRVRPEYTATAKAAVDEIEARRFADIDRLGDPEAWIVAYLAKRDEKDPEMEAIDADPANFRDPRECHVLENLAAWAFHDGDGNQPDALGDNSSKSLEQLLSHDLDGSDYSGRAFNARRSDTPDPTETDQRPEIREAETGVGRFAAIEAMLLLDGAVCEIGLIGEIAARMREYSDVEFKNYNSPGYEIPSLIGYGGVYRDGGRMSLGTVGTIVDLWDRRACLSLDRHGARFVELVGQLSSNGHVSADSEFDCHDWNDWVWLEEIDETSGVVWFRSTGTRLAMQYELDGSGERLVDLQISEERRVQADGGNEWVFLAHFVRTEEGFVADPVGEFSSFNYVTLEKALGGYISLSAALREEYGNHNHSETVIP
jgi:hypothetical protein